MDKQGAIERLRSEGRVIAPGQKYVVDDFRPGDAWGVARLYSQGFGEAYPVDTSYVPDRLVAAWERGEARTAAARTESDDIVGKVDMFHRSAPNPHVFEAGPFFILPEYRNSLIFVRANQRILAAVDASDILEAQFCESVTNHAATQKISARNRTLPTAVELGLLPPDYTAQEGKGRCRETCLLEFRINRDRPQAVHLPERWRELAAFLYQGLPVSREVRATAAYRRRVAGGRLLRPSQSSIRLILRSCNSL